MRQAGTLPTKNEAELFTNFLLATGISAKCEPSGDQWAIWIHDENLVDRSKEELAAFRQHPTDERYRQATRVAQQVRRETADKQRQAQRNYVDMRNEWSSPWRRRPVTLTLIIISTLVYLSSSDNLLYELVFSLPHILQGEVWRLVTPIFLHFSPLHILFNMWMLYDLGTLIERRLGSLWFALLVLAIAVPSNYGQYQATGAGFGGMSGVVYGLFGYAWTRGRLEPTSGLYLRNDVAVWMIGWFILCILNPSMNVANWAHGVGLVTGAALGAVPYIGQQLRQKT